MQQTEFQPSTENIFSICKDWRGENLPESEFDSSNVYRCSIRLSHSCGDLLISVDAPFYDDPRPPPIYRILTEKEIHIPPVPTASPYFPLPSVAPPPPPPLHLLPPPPPPLQLPPPPPTPPSSVEQTPPTPPMPTSPPPPPPLTSKLNHSPLNLSQYTWPELNSSGYGSDDDGFNSGSHSEADINVALDKYHYPGLHNFEVVEIFIASFHNEEEPSENPYLEVQIGPHGNYMVVFFEREQDWETQNASIKLDTFPITTIDRAAGRWTSEITIPSFLLPEPIRMMDDNGVLTAQWRMNYCAIHGESENRRYLSHATYTSSLPIPNFHQLDCFVPLVLPLSEPALSVRAILGAPPPLPPPPPPPPPPSLPVRAPSLTDALDTAESVQDDGQQSLLNLNQVKSFPDLSNRLEEVARKIKSDRDTLLPKGGLLDWKITQTFARGEFEAMHGIIWKRKGVSLKKRVLVLTSHARLIYFTLDSELKGSIPWSASKPLGISKLSTSRLDLEVFDKSRIYHLSAVSWTADLWIDAISRMSEAMSLDLT